MDYEKKLREALDSDETDWEVVRWIERTSPELAESEDERIRKWLVDYFTGIGENWIHREFTCKQIVAYLEKQKENPKSADSIPSDCVSDVKCEDRWHKTANSLPDNGRDVLAKDVLGNYLLASFDGAQWFVSVYDGEDHPVLHTPPILEWWEIPSEKQKEQKPVQSPEEKEYVRQLKALVSCFVRDKKPKDVEFYQQIWNWLDGLSGELMPIESD